MKVAWTTRDHFSDKFPKSLSLKAYTPPPPSNTDTSGRCCMRQDVVVVEVSYYQIWLGSHLCSPETTVWQDPLDHDMWHVSSVLANPVIKINKRWSNVSPGNSRGRSLYTVRKQPSYRLSTENRHCRVRLCLCPKLENWINRSMFFSREQ